jgi:hypothetical protein
VDLIQTLGSKKNPGLGLESEMGLIEEKMDKLRFFVGLDCDMDWISI